MLFLATVALWVRSHWREDAIFRTHERELIYGGSANGVLLFGYHRSYSTYRGGAVHGWSIRSGPINSTSIRLPDRTAWNRLGFAYRRRQGQGEFVGLLDRELFVPYWLATTAVGMPAAIWLWRTRRRPQTGFCPRCNYYLRATPTRCPECGTIPKTQASPLP
jgi:hypothetical protein